MKVVFLTYDAWPTSKAATSRKVGGLNTIIFHLSRALAKEPGMEVGVVCCYSKAKLSPAERAEGVRTDQIIFDANLNSLRRYLIEIKPDVIHTSGSDAGRIMAQIREDGFGFPWVHTNYATLAVRRVMVEKLTVIQALADETAKNERLSLKECDLVIALSEVDKREICAVFGVNRAKVTVALPGVDRSIFTAKGGVDREHLVVSAGRMSEIKDFPFLLRAFQLVVEQSGKRKPKLLIIGGNGAERYRLNLPAQIEHLGLKPYARFLDGMEQAELAKYFQRAKVFAGSSRHETFGLLPLEARACGTPTVVRKNSSYLLLAENGYGGYLSGDRSESDMADKIARILSLNRDQWETMSRDATDSARRYSWSAMARKCQEVYRDIISKSRKL